MKFTQILFNCTTYSSILFISYFWFSLFVSEVHAEASQTDNTKSVIHEIDKIVRDNYFATDELIDWERAVSEANILMSSAKDNGKRTSIIKKLLATLDASHTNYFPREDPAYWQIAAIFEPYLMRVCASDQSMKFPITVLGIGVFWELIEDRWFVGGVYPDMPAEKAGLKLGDEIILANGISFSPVRSFQHNKETELTVRRKADAPTEKIRVNPVSIKPHELFREATEKSWRIIEVGDQKIAYIHIWSWTSIEIQQAVLMSITKSNQASVDGFILDLRDGWGGASPHYLTLFDQNVPILQSIDRNGLKSTYDAQIRKPTVMLINAGTRSGKEIIAFGAKKHALATLVGEQTAGAVVVGQPFCLSDGGLLFLSVADAVVDGERLEGNGVNPDIEVLFDIRYANGKDLQFQSALKWFADH